MIEYIAGRLTALNPACAVVEASGIGYLVNITLPTFSALSDAKETRLLIHEVIREDTHELYGFADEAERTLFRALLSVSGVGANTARMILSSIPAPQLEQVIIAGDHNPLKAVKGIGLKTAQRIIVDLKDKIKPSGTAMPGELPLAQSMPDAAEEALAALVILGFPRPAAQKVLRKLYDADPTLAVEAAIKKALAML